jgi:DNA-binding response OmpR family regulator
MKILMIGSEIRLAYDLHHEMGAAKHTIRYAPDAALGLKIALSGKFDLIILGWAPPKIDGLTVMRGLRERGNPTPVLVSAGGYLKFIDPEAGTCRSKAASMDAALSRIKALMVRR